MKARTGIGIKIGISVAEENGMSFGDRASNSEILQFEGDDVRKFFRMNKPQGAFVTGGSSYDKNGGFWFGSFAYIEGNPFCVVNKNCP